MNSEEIATAMKIGKIDRGEKRMMWIMKVLIVLFTIHCSLFTSYAQVSVEASIDNIEMLVGQQTHVTIKAVAKENSKVEFPTFQPSQYVTPGVEVLSSQPQNDKAADNGFVEKSMVYTLTSFDDTLYYIPPMTVKVDGKPYQTKSLALKVLTIEVDTTHLYVRLRDNKPIITHIRIVKRLLPHQKAMKEIEQIKADKMVTSENPKEYYTKLTDTLRKYIEERYGFNAMEMTSSEIIEKLMATQNQKSLDELRHLFTTADLVKFAKYSTLINENDMNLVSAIDFINQTKLENVPTEETVKPQLSEEDQRNVKTRRLLKIIIPALLVISVALLAYVVWSVYQLIN